MMNIKTNMARFAGLAGGATLALANAAHAHTGHSSVSGFAAGFSHPLGGLDHALAMVAVGLWAARQGGRAMWAIPAAFVGAMAVGGALGMAGVALPFVEGGILASILVLGLLLATGAKLPASAGAAIAGAFAIFHGHAHGAEMPASASGIEYALGFVAASGLLHAAGIGLALAIGRAACGPRASEMPLRFAGAAVALAGLVIGAM